MVTKAGKILWKDFVQTVRLLDTLERRNIVPASGPQHCGRTDTDLQAEPAEAVTQKHNYVYVSSMGAVHTAAGAGKEAQLNGCWCSSTAGFCRRLS